MMDGLTWVLSVIGKVFGLFENQVLGIPMYMYIVFFFVMTMIASFIWGKR